MEYEKETVVKDGDYWCQPGFESPVPGKWITSYPKPRVEMGPTSHAGRPKKNRWLGTIIGFQLDKLERIIAGIPKHSTGRSVRRKQRNMRREKKELEEVLK